MNFISRLFKPRESHKVRILDGKTVKALLVDALKGSLTPNYRHIGQKDRMAVCRMSAIEEAASKSYMPWKKDVWECEDQARALLHECQKRAANEGCSWACGTLRGDNLAIHDTEGTLHVWLWAIVEKPGANRFQEARVMCYDATARKWTDLADIGQIDYTIT